MIPYGLKASEVIRELQELIDEHGDQYVFGGCSDYPQGVEGAAKQEKHNNPYIPFGTFFLY